MSYRITLSNVHGAFKRLHSAMDWPSGPAYTNGKFVVGAIYLGEGFRSFSIERVVNEMGGTDWPLSQPWASKREAFNSMVAMAEAVETFKRAQDDSLAA